MSTVFKVLYVNPGTGEHGRLPDLGLTNIGGTTGPTFFVGGKPLLFADGTATDGSNSALLANTLQGVYNMSSPATVNFISGKDLQFTAVSGQYFNFNADTGKVTISGDLEVLGSINSGGSAAVRTYEHIQVAAGSNWTFVHARASHNPTVTIYDDDNHQVLPDDVEIIDDDTLTVRFNTPMAGRAVCLFFD